MKKNQRTPVIVVQITGDSALVQYETNGITERRYIPADEIGDRQVLTEVLERGVPYGYPYDDIKLEFDSQKFANELHNVGVWTAEDALLHPQKLWSAMNAAFADNITNVIRAAKLEKRRTR